MHRFPWNGFAIQRSNSGVGGCGGGGRAAAEEEGGSLGASCEERSGDSGEEGQQEGSRLDARQAGAEQVCRRGTAAAAEAGGKGKEAGKREEDVRGARERMREEEKVVGADQGKRGKVSGGPEDLRSDTLRGSERARARDRGRESARAYKLLALQADRQMSESESMT